MSEVTLYSNVELLDVYQSRGAVGDAVSDIRHCVTNRLEGGGHVGPYERSGCMI